MKSLFELTSSKISNLVLAKYIGMFDVESNPVEEILEIRRKADRDLINKEFCSAKTRGKWWMHISFFDEEDESPRWARFVKGKMLTTIINGVGRMGKRTRKANWKGIVDYYGFKIVNNEIQFVDAFFDQLYISLYEGNLSGHIRQLLREEQEFLFWNPYGFWSDLEVVL